MTTDFDVLVLDFDDVPVPAAPVKIYYFDKLNHSREVGSAAGLTNNSGHASFKAPSDHLSMLIAFHRQYWTRTILEGARHFPIYVDPGTVGKGE